MKVKRIKLYDGYITINQEPKKWAFNSSILHLRKNMKGKNVKKRSKKNNRRTVEAVEDAWTGAQPAGLEMHHRGEAPEGAWLSLRRMLRYEGPLQVQER